MKFLCPNCKAKYQIADEKVAGRTLRMDCRRCGHNIAIRADMADEGEVPEAAGAPPTAGAAPAAGATKPRTSVRPPGAARGGSAVGPNPLGPPSGGTASGSAAARAGVRPSGATGAHGASNPGALGFGGGSALGADFRRNVGSSPEAPRTTPLDQWHVAINDVPVGPMRREEIVKKIAAGAVTPDSLCWREGLEDWRPLRDIAELAALWRRSLAPEPAARAPGARAPLGTGVPVRAPGPAAPGARPTTATQRAAARSNVVPIGGRLGAAAAPAIDEPDLEGDDADEPTRVGNFDLAEFEAKAMAAEREAKRAAEDARAEAKIAEAKAAEAKRAEARAVEARAAEKAAESELSRKPPTGKISTKALPPPPRPLGRPDTGRTALQQPTPARHETPARPEVQPPPALAEEEHDLPIAEPVFAEAPSRAAPERAPVVAPLAAPAPAAAVATAAVLPKPAQEERRRGGIPVGAWIAIAGATAFGAVLAVMVGNRFLGGPVAPAPVVTVAPTPTAPPTPPPTVAEVTPPPAEAPTEATEVPVVPAEAPTTEVATTTPAHTAGTRPHTGGGATATPGTTTPAAGAGGTGATATTKAPSGRFAAFADSPSGSGPAAIPTGPQRSVVDEAEGAASRGQAELTADQIRGVITRERPALNRCWEMELRRLGQAATVRLDVDLAIGGSGTVTSVTTRGQSVGTLADCIERNVRRWRFPPVNGSTQTSFPLVFSGTD